MPGCHQKYTSSIETARASTPYNGGQDPALRPTFGPAVEYTSTRQVIPSLIKLVLADRGGAGSPWAWRAPTKSPTTINISTAELANVIIRKTRSTSEFEHSHIIQCQPFLASITTSISIFMITASEINFEMVFANARLLLVHLRVAGHRLIFSSSSPSSSHLPNPHFPPQP